MAHTTAPDELAPVQESPAAGLGRPLPGPTALGDDLGRFARLTWTLAVTEFRLRFYGSMLGYLWQLMRPLLLFGVLFVVFTEFVRIGGDIRYYSVVLLTGIVLFTFVGEGAGGAVGSVVERESLIRKVAFPRMAIPCSVVVTALLNLGLNLLFVRYRDVKPIWDVVLQVMFYASPILYPVETVPEKWQPLVMLNPLALVNQQLRHAAIDPTAPSALDVGGFWGVAGGLAVAFGLLALGAWVYVRRAPAMAEDL
jgi:ABC-2 type transport system permease protein